jgi:hypothetical protein
VEEKERINWKYKYFNMSKRNKSEKVAIVK